MRCRDAILGQREFRVAMDILRKQNSGIGKLGQQEDSLLWSNSWTSELGVSHAIVRSVKCRLVDDTYVWPRAVCVVGLTLRQSQLLLFLR